MDATSLKRFNRLLKQRGESQCSIADMADVARAHLSQVFSGRRCGLTTKPKVAPLLTTEELWLLGWTSPSLPELQWPHWEVEYWRRLFYAAPAGSLLRKLYLEEVRKALAKIPTVNGGLK